MPRRRPSKGARAIYEMATRSETAEFFNKMLTDEFEQSMWMVFMTGKAPKEVEVEENGQKVRKLTFEDVEPNPTSLKAFLRAVEYKRGAPIVLKDDSGGKVPQKVVEVITIGATVEYFKDAAKARGLLTVKSSEGKV